MLKLKENKQIVLYEPKLDDLWFRQECNQDPNTMSYNAGYDLHCDGYHFETGCIDFPKAMWNVWIEKIKNPNMFFAYIQDEKTKKFVGYVNFRKDEKSNSASVGILIKNEFRGQGYMQPAMQKLIEKARFQRIDALTDNVPENRENALKVFYDLGFRKIGEFSQLKFGKKELVAKISLQL